MSLSRRRRTVVFRTVVIRPRGDTGGGDSSTTPPATAFACPAWPKRDSRRSAGFAAQIQFSPETPSALQTSLASPLYPKTLKPRCTGRPRVPHAPAHGEPCRAHGEPCRRLLRSVGGVGRGAGVGVGAPLRAAAARGRGGHMVRGAGGGRRSDMHAHTNSHTNAHTNAHTNTDVAHTHALARVGDASRGRPRQATRGRPAWVVCASGWRRTFGGPRRRSPEGDAARGGGSSSRLPASTPPARTPRSSARVCSPGLRRCAAPLRISITPVRHPPRVPDKGLERTRARARYGGEESPRRRRGVQYARDDNVQVSTPVNNNVQSRFPESNASRVPPAWSGRASHGMNRGHARHADVLWGLYDCTTVGPVCGPFGFHSLGGGEGRMKCAPSISLSRALTAPCRVCHTGNRACLSVFVLHVRTTFGEGDRAGVYTPRAGHRSASLAYPSHHIPA
eukprot:1185341-Prorocentrum_minimum.AAC.9